MIASGTSAFECVCGKRGCFECHASAAGLVRHWRAAGGDERAISLDDAKAVLERLRGGDRIAASAWLAYKADLATGLSALFLNPNPNPNLTLTLTLTLTRRTSPPAWRTWSPSTTRASSCSAAALRGLLSCTTGCRLGLEVKVRGRG